MVAHEPPPADGVTSRDLDELYRPPVDSVIPTARELGLRLRSLRDRQGLTVEDVAQRALVHPDEVRDFETYGIGEIETVLALVEEMSMSSSFHDAFALPKFKNIEEVVEYAGRSRA